jgi:DNA-binding LytR/AlgR family response regulator
MKVLIIEDELLTAKDLERTIKNIEPDIEIAGIAETVEDAIEFLKNNTETDLIFSDIQLGKHLSFEIFRNIKTNIPVIFCTAYNEYALEAFDTFSIDYILKPFNKNTIEKALGKYHNLKQKFSEKSNNFNSILDSIEQKITKKSSSILIYSGDKIIPLPISEIAVFYIENEITYCIGFDSKKSIINDKLDKLEEKCGNSFFRANRQFLVNRKSIKDAEQYFNRKMLINLNIPFNDKIIISKMKVAEFLNWLSV